MFDISFSELVVIALVALLVIGPEKLPKVARTAGAFFGRLQRFMAQVKEEVQRESRFEALQQLQAEVSSSLQQEVNALNQSIASPQLMETLAPSASAESTSPTVRNVDTQIAKKTVARRNKSQAAERVPNTINHPPELTEALLLADAPPRRRGRPKKNLVVSEPPSHALMEHPPAVSPAPTVRKPRRSNKAAPTE